MDAITKKFEGVDAALEKVLDKLTAIEAWRSTTTASMDKLLTQSERTANRIDLLESAPSTSTAPPLPRPSTAPPQHPPRWTNPFDLNMAPHPEMRPPASSAERPSGHGVVNHHRDVGGGILGSHPPHPVTGMSLNNLPPVRPEPAFSHPPVHHEFIPGSQSPMPRSSPLPKLDFPKFDGENPRIWRDRCEMFFEVYGVSESLKTRFAALNFSGAAASWLHSVECKGRVTEWEEFCTLVCERFDRNQYQDHMKNLDSLRQLGSVDEYYNRFVELAHQILLYNPAYDHVFFVTRFL